jgi:hypothetical protein
MIGSLTEAELWRLAAQPALFAIVMLSFLKAPLRVRLVAAAVGAVVGLAIGLITLWAQRSGAPWWLGWVFAAPLIALAGWRRIMRRPHAANDR